jgi:dCTP deaminase
MIDPFSESVSGNGIISYGLTSAGYDLRLGPEVLVFKNSYGHTIDPKRFKDPNYTREVFDTIAGGPGVAVTIPAHGYILGHSMEYLRIPRNLKARCTGKSTYARAGIIVNTTPLEPEWEGHLTIEISNSSPCPAVVYIGEGIAQLEFERLTDEPEVSYADKGGKYQSQTGVTPAKVI